MRQFQVRVFMQRIIALVVYTVIFPTLCQKYTESRWHDEKEVNKLNEARTGSFLDFIEDFAERFPACVDEYETLLTDNRIWKQRTVDIGVVSPERAFAIRIYWSNVAWLRCGVGFASQAAI